MCETGGVTRTGALFEGIDLFRCIYQGLKDCFGFSSMTIRRDKANRAPCILVTSHVSN